MCQYYPSMFKAFTPLYRLGRLMRSRLKICTLKNGFPEKPKSATKRFLRISIANFYIKCDKTKKHNWTVQPWVLVGRNFGKFMGKTFCKILAQLYEQKRKKTFDVIGMCIVANELLSEGRIRMQITIKLV